MARSVRARIETRSARLRLPGAKDPYWQSLERELSAGYHRPKNGGAGTWWGRVRIDGKYVKKALATADDHLEANGETILDWSQAQAAVRAWAAKQAAAGPYTVADACREYVADLRARKGDRAADEADGRLKKHLLPELGDRRLADLTTADLTKWRNGLVDDEDDEDEEAIRRSRDTANRIRGIAWAAFNLAFNGDKVTDDRAWRRVGPFEDVGEARKTFLSEAERQRLIDECEPGLKEFALLVAWTGARPGKELTEARRRDLDLERGTLTVKSNKGRRGRVRYRDIYLDPQALTLLRRLASGKRPDEHLLTTSDGTPWTKSLHSRRVAAAVEKAGLDPETCLYSLRHSYIAQALMKGTPVDSVAAQCGTSIAMIQKYYRKLIPSDLAKHAKKAAPKLRADAEGKVFALRTGSAA